MSAPNTPAKMLLRSLAALTYDLLILPAILLLAGAVAVFPAQWLLPELTFDHGPARWLLQAWLAGSAFLFLGHSWTRAGQTIGMRAWRIRLVDAQGHNPGWTQAALRFATGLVLLLAALSAGQMAHASLGSAWAGVITGLLVVLPAWLLLLVPPHRSLQDRLSGTHLVYLPKR